MDWIQIYFAAILALGFFGVCSDPRKLPDWTLGVIVLLPVIGRLYRWW